MNEPPLTPARILDAAEETLRRFGPAKTTVVDVARALGVSHGSVYRHFPSKAALRDAVAERWLRRVSAPLEEFRDGDDTAARRLRDWLLALSGTKQRMAREDPELFATYHAIVVESRDVIGAHLGVLAEQLEAIIGAGVARGEFAAEDPKSAARAVLTATARFHNPVHASEWDDPALAEDFEAVWSLLLCGLAARKHP
ncbi:TetR family transcriptional regulator [Saccharopolyspora erythraea NRRL 2338]|uniref:TetR-family transcriptional regulator n=2 Tax=Saccharopolyspora erythraea TaxID=1836 RepID=A4FEV2_SACEN|nr:TetR family transcriptional regulator [Saccharopolyspora erythraea]EQD82472.1 TetR family transcriptional regulator [Saccharopolyspora erythraea D]PFG96302.1 TetR family transcriptional regulator [Saccharopolyspora erythraea NRRL 2338]QRK92821.1 TetR family transcriptional regulator [Saccharopolyspora erythraea]CAM02577.1 TetR-family transcriptional regulator [Saccharopolyspora erythraea NRRL 2338]